MTRNVLVIEDSPIAGALLTHLLERGGYHVLACMENGDGVRATPEYACADIVLLDLLLPGRSGLSLLREFIPDKPVIVVSDAARDSPLVREALAQGAHAYVSKRTLGEGAALWAALASTRKMQPPQGPKIPLVVLVGSTGAVPALAELLRNTRDVRAQFVVVQHIIPGAELRFCEWLTGLGRPAFVVTGPTAFSAQRVLIPPPTHHLLIAEPDLVALSDAPPHEGHRPSAVPLLRSAVHLGPRVVAIILSGLGRDGCDALPELLSHGASCLVQRPEDCIAPSMPRAALEAAPQARCLSVRGMVQALRSLKNDGR